MQQADGASSLARQASSTRRVVGLALAVAVLLGGLSASPASATRGGDSAVSIPDVDILELTPGMANFLVRHVSTRQDPETQLLQLMDAFFGRKGLRIKYEGDGTWTAADTFKQRRGNCLSFTILFVAMARHLGLDAYFQEVDEVISWDRRGEVLVRNQHMIVEVEVINGRRRIDFLPEAVKRYRAVKRISDERALAHFYNNRGVESLADGDTKRALAYFDRALEVDDTFSDSWTNRGVALRRLDDFAAAESSHLRALEINAHESAAMTNLASLYQASGRVDEAEPLLRRINADLQRNPFHHFRQGMASAANGALDEATQRFRTAIRRMPDEPEFHAALAGVLERSGDTAKARESLEKALELTEDKDARKRLTRQLEKLEER